MDIKAKITKGEWGNIKGMVTLTIDNSLVIKGLKIIESNKGNLFISFPNRKMPNGEYTDTVFPITKELREQIINTIMSEYNKGTDNKYEQEERQAIQEENNYDTYESDLPF